MRIISGKYKGRRLLPPSNITARPTTDFAKESLFNLLTNRVNFEEIRVLDLFAGTGSISLEFLSRGARSVTSVEMASLQLEFMRKTAKQLNINNWLVTRSDVFQYIKRCNIQFDVVFADPPYQMPELPDLPEILFENNIITAGGMFILEHPKQYDFSSKPCFAEHRKYGNVNFTFFSCDE